MNLSDNVRLGKIHNIVVLLQWLVMMGVRLAATCLLWQAVVLEGTPIGAVEYQHLVLHNYH